MTKPRRDAARQAAPQTVAASLALAVVLTLTLTPPATAEAQMLRDPQLAAAHAEERYDALRQAATQRRQADPDDAEALLALTLVALEGNDTEARRALLADTRACSERKPSAQPCVYAAAVLDGLDAASQGLFAMARRAGAVREGLTRAHEIDPAWYPARSALVEFHAVAPAVMGGSRARAEELAKSAPTPQQAAMLGARLLLGDGKAAASLQALSALPLPSVPHLQADWAHLGSQAALTLVNQGQPADAGAWFERLMRERAGHADGAYGLARVKGELGDWAQAEQLLLRAATLKRADRWPVAYRLGIAQQQLGRLDAARASLQRFVDAGKGQKASLEDARKRLAQLKAGGG
jgi:tetratricopeptide (TPR) repeat protein